MKGSACFSAPLRRRPSCSRARPSSSARSVFSRAFHSASLLARSCSSFSRRERSAASVRCAFARSCSSCARRERSAACAFARSRSSCARRQRSAASASCASARSCELIRACCSAPLRRSASRCSEPVRGSPKFGGPGARGCSFLRSWASEDDWAIALEAVGAEGGGGIESSIALRVISSGRETVKVARRP